MSDLNWLFHPLLLSAKTILVSFILLVVLRLPVAYFLAFYKGRLKAIFDALVMFPLIFPPIATGFLLLYLLGRNGVIGSVLNLDIVFSFYALVIASFLAGLPLFVSLLWLCLKISQKVL